MKKFFAVVLSLAMVSVLFSACGATVTTPPQPTYFEISMYSIPGYTNLSYISENGSETGTVYYYRGSSNGYSYMAPYIVNGHFCEYVDGEIVEVIPTVRIEDTTNCGATVTTPPQPTYFEINMYSIPGYTNLSYISENGSETGTVYYYRSRSNGYSYMAPYIVNGHFCEYVDGEIVEVIPTVRIEDTTN